MERLDSLIEKYWDCAWQQGYEQRRHDNAAGDAQRLSCAITDEIKRMQEEIEVLQDEVEMYRNKCDNWHDEIVFQITKKRKAQAELATAAAERDDNHDRAEQIIKARENQIDRLNHEIIEQQTTIAGLVEALKYVQMED